MPNKCQHRRYTARPVAGGYVLVCKNCGLTTRAEYKDLGDAVMHARDDFRDAAAERLATARREREVRV
jgi:transcription elongation factor Elf1